MKNKIILSGTVLLITALAMIVSGCTKAKDCGHCKITTTTFNSSGPSSTTSNGSKVCDGDGGVTYALDNAKNDCSALNNTGSGGTYHITTEWVSE